MSPSEVMLTVTLADEGTEVFVIDTKQRQQVHRRGGFSVKLPPGLYAVRAVAGYEQQEKIAVLLPGMPATIEFGKLRFATAIPLEDTGTSHEYHQSFTQQLLATKPEELGDGATLMVMARTFTRGNQQPKSVENPAKRLTLCDAAGRIVRDFEKIIEWSEPGQDPCGGVHLRLDPGLYRLKHRLDSKLTVEQTIPVVRNWRTEVFLLHGVSGDECSIDLTTSADFNGADPSRRLNELATAGLKNRRQVLGDQQVSDILHGKFTDPMLGLLGVHLMLETTPSDEAVRDLQFIVNNLRNLLGSANPDVEALALLTPKGTSHVFATPPSLRRSWKLLLDGSITRPNLIPEGSLAAKAATKVLAEEPWLLWTAAPPEPETDVPRMESLQLDEVDQQEPWELEALTHLTKKGPWTVDNLVRSMGLPRNRVETLLDQLGHRSPKPSADFPRVTANALNLTTKIKKDAETAKKVDELPLEVSLMPLPTNPDRAAWERYKAQHETWKAERADWQSFQAAERQRAIARTDKRTAPVTAHIDLLEMSGEHKNRLLTRIRLLNPLDGVGLEALFGRNDILPLNYLRLGERAARSVCRVEVRDGAGRHIDFGTGFLVSPTLLLTNQHVLRTKEEAIRSLAEFDVEENEDFRPRVRRTFRLDPARFFHNDEILDFTLVAVEPNAEDGTPLTDYGMLLLIEDSGKALLDEPVTIIHHPNGGDKRITLRNNTILGLVDAFIQYTTDTLRGSSGSPVLNDQWQVVCLHHRAVGRQDDQGRYLTKNNRLWKPEMGEAAIDWVANEGLRISSLFQGLRAKKDWTAIQAGLLAEMGVLVQPALGGAGLTNESFRSAIPIAAGLRRAAPPVISIDEFNRLVDDPNTTEAVLGTYVVLDPAASGAFDPVFRLNRGRVVDPRGLESDRALNWANGWCRRQRQRAYRRRLEAGGQIIKIVSEGDSWFQYPFILDDVIDDLMGEPDFAVCSLDAGGDLITDMIANGEYLDFLRQERPDVFLISGGGNDMLGDGRLANFLHPFAPGRQAEEYPNDAFADFLQGLGDSYRRVFAGAQAEVPGVRVFCHSYDYAIPNDGPWLGRPMRGPTLNIADRGVQAAIVRHLIDRVTETMKAVATEFPQVTHIDLRNCVGGVDEWHDELHPRDAGFRRISDQFIRAIRAAVAPR